MQENDNLLLAQPLRPTFSADLYPLALATPPLSGSAPLVLAVPTGTRVTQVQLEAPRGGTDGVKLTAAHAEALLADPRLKVSTVQVEVVRLRPIELQGLMYAQSQLLGAPTVHYAFAAALDGVLRGHSNLEAIIGRLRALVPKILDGDDGAINGVSNLQGTLRLSRPLAGTMAAQSDLRATLKVRRPVRCLTLEVTVHAEQTVDAELPTPSQTVLTHAEETVQVTIYPCVSPPPAAATVSAQWQVSAQVQPQAGILRPLLLSPIPPEA